MQVLVADTRQKAAAAAVAAALTKFQLRALTSWAHIQGAAHAQGAGWRVEGGPHLRPGVKALHHIHLGLGVGGLHQLRQPALVQGASRHHHHQQRCKAVAAQGACLRGYGSQVHKLHLQVAALPLSEGQGSSLMLFQQVCSCPEGRRQRCMHHACRVYSRDDGTLPVQIIW